MLTSSILALLALAILMHSITLFLYGRFVDENTMTALLSIRQALPYGHPVPDYLSGTPYIFAEQGLVWMGILAYETIGKYIGLFAALYGIKILFTVIAGLVVYKFAEKIKDSKSGLFALGLYAVSQVGMYNEALDIWKGEEFTIISLFLGLLLLAYMIDAFKSKKLMTLALFSPFFAISIIFSVLIWNGGDYTIGALIFVILSLYIWRFFKNKRLVFGLIGLFSIIFFVVALFAPTPFLTTLQSNFLRSFSVRPSNLLQMVSQVQINLFQNQILWTSSPLYYLQLLCGTVLYLGFILYSISRLKLEKEKGDVLVILFAAFIIGIPFALANQSWSFLIYLPIAIFAGIGIGELWEKKDMRIRMACVLTIGLYIALGIVQVALFTRALPVINYPYLYAIQWIANNTPKNSIFLTYQSYGTPIEYYANRTSMFDTNINDAPNTTYNLFIGFLLQPKGNFTYIYNLNLKPNYMLIDKRWTLQYQNNTTGNLSSMNLGLFESAPYSIIAQNMSIDLVYNNYNIAIYKFEYNVTGFGPGKLGVCRSPNC